jgi:IS30 family transposase
MTDLADFERGQIVGARLAGAPVRRIATLLGVLRATVYKIMSSAYMDRGNKISEKRNIDRKRSLCVEKDCFEKSPKYCSIGDSKTEHS